MANHLKQKPLDRPEPCKYNRHRMHEPPVTKVPNMKPTIRTRQKQRKLPINTKANKLAVTTGNPTFHTYSKRTENLSNVLATGGAIFQKIVLPTKRKHKKKDNNKILESIKTVRQKLQLWRTKNGLTSNHGFVKTSTEVLFHDTRYLQKFDSHPFFHSIPYAIVRKTNGEKLFDKLRCLENEILELLKTSTNNYTAHKYGANEGLNCGLSCVGGGTLSNKEAGISGTVQWSGFIKGKPELRKRLCGLFQRILNDCFGNCLWYKRLLHLTTKINTESGNDRTLPGLPLSGMWFNIVPKQEAVHCDRNVVGATFVLSTYRDDGAALVLSTTCPNHVEKIQINPPMILAGKWANFAHCNTNVSTETESKRQSWTLYLDKRIFSTRYRYNIPNGFKE